jgi:hypothetical protein
MEAITIPTIDPDKIARTDNALPPPEEEEEEEEA